MNNKDVLGAKDVLSRGHGREKSNVLGFHPTNNLLKELNTKRDSETSFYQSRNVEELLSKSAKSRAELNEFVKADQNKSPMVSDKGGNARVNARYNKLHKLQKQLNLRKTSDFHTSIQKPSFVKDCFSNKLELEKIHLTEKPITQSPIRDYGYDKETRTNDDDGSNSNNSNNNSERRGQFFNVYIAISSNRRYIYLTKDGRPIDNYIINFETQLKKVVLSREKLRLVLLSGPDIIAKFKDGGMEIKKYFKNHSIDKVHTDFASEEEQAVSVGSSPRQLRLQPVPQPLPQSQSLLSSPKSPSSAMRDPLKDLVPTRARRHSPRHGRQAENFVIAKEPEEVNNEKVEEKTHFALPVRSSPRRKTRQSEVFPADDSSEAYMKFFDKLSHPQPNEKIPKLVPSLRYQFDDGTEMIIDDEDLSSLFHHNWVNDKIIDFGLKYSMEQAVKEGLVNANDIYAFSCYFYIKLIQKDARSKDTPPYYENIKRWLRRIDLLSYQYIILPINLDSHWFCCIIRNLPDLIKIKDVPSMDNGEKMIAEGANDYSNGKTEIENENGNKKSEQEQEQEQEQNKRQNKKDLETIEMDEITDNIDDIEVNSASSQEEINGALSQGLDSQTGRSKGKAEIFVFDSLGTRRDSVKIPLKEFIIGYCKDKHSIEVSRDQIRVTAAKVPRQNNFNDCGVHVLYNVRKWLQKITECESHWRRYQFGATKLLFPAEERSKERHYWIDILLQLHSEQKLKEQALGLSRVRNKGDGDDNDDDNDSSNNGNNNKNNKDSGDDDNDDGDDDDDIEIVEESYYPYYNENSQDQDSGQNVSIDYNNDNDNDKSQSTKTNSIGNEQLKNLDINQHSVEKDVVKSSSANLVDDSTTDVRIHQHDNASTTEQSLQAQLDQPTQISESSTPSVQVSRKFPEPLKNAHNDQANNIDHKDFESNSLQDKNVDSSLSRENFEKINIHAESDCKEPPKADLKILQIQKRISDAMKSASTRKKSLADHSKPSLSKHNRSVGVEMGIIDGSLVGGKNATKSSKHHREDIGTKLVEVEKHQKLEKKMSLGRESPTSSEDIVDVSSDEDLRQSVKSNSDIMERMKPLSNGNTIETVDLRSPIRKGPQTSRPPITKTVKETYVKSSSPTASKQSIVNGKVIDPIKQVPDISKKHSAIRILRKDASSIDLTKEDRPAVHGKGKRRRLL